MDRAPARLMAHPNTPIWEGLCLELRLANYPPTHQRLHSAAAMGYCMASDHDIGVSMSPQPPQDSRWAIFVPASYKNMALGEPELQVWRGLRGLRVCIIVSLFGALKRRCVSEANRLNWSTVTGESTSPGEDSTGASAERGGGL
jgi:hypothetical protein